MTREESLNLQVGDTVQLLRGKYRRVAREVIGIDFGQREGRTVPIYEMASMSGNGRNSRCSAITMQRTYEIVRSARLDSIQ